MWWCWTIIASKPAPTRWRMSIPTSPATSPGLTYLCAAGVTFLFLVGLNRALRDSGFYAARGIAEPDLREHLDLVGLATVCDVVPLIGVNRAFVRQGLAQLSKLARPGLAALAAVAKAAPPFTAYHLGFVFGPRINAGGRVGRSGLGADLLTATTTPRQREASRVQLDLHNRERQANREIDSGGSGRVGRRAGQCAVPAGGE